MVVQYIEQILLEKSNIHQASLSKLEAEALEKPLSDRIVFLEQTPQLRGMNTILHDTTTGPQDFIFYFDRLGALLVERALNNSTFVASTIETPYGHHYAGLRAKGEVSAVLLQRGGAALEKALKRVIPDCKLSHILIESNIRTAEPELKYQKMAKGLETHETVLVLDAQMSSGGSALMAVQVLIDFGVSQERIVFATYSAGKMGLRRLTSVFPGIAVIVCNLVEDVEERWVEVRYFRC